MNLSGLAKLIIGVTFAIGFVILCAMKVVPPEAFCIAATAAITFIVEEWSKEREIARIMASLKKEGK